MLLAFADGVSLGVGERVCEAVGVLVSLGKASDPSLSSSPSPDFFGTGSSPALISSSGPLFDSSGSRAECCWRSATSGSCCCRGTSGRTGPTSRVPARSRNDAV